MTELKSYAIPLMLLSFLAAGLFGCDSALSARGLQRVTPGGREWLDATGISWSPSGDALALTCSFSRGSGLAEGVPQGYLYLLDLESHSTTVLSQTITEDGDLYSPSWSPSSDQIAFFASGPRWDPQGIWLAQTDSTGSPRFLGSGKDCAWSPDGERMAIAVFPRRYRTSGYQIDILNVRTGQVERTFLITDERYVFSDGISWSPVGNRVAFSVDRGSQSTGGGTYELDLASGIWRLLLEGGGYGSPSWSPDGEMLALSGGQSAAESTLLILRVEDGAIIRPLDVTPVGPVAWSPDGSRIAFVWYGSGVYTVDAAVALREWLTTGE